MRLKKITALHALALLTLSAPVFADVQDIESANNQVVAQIQNNHMVYDEIANGALLDSEDGHIKGYGLSGSVMKDLWLGHDYLAVQYGSFDGKTNYTGGTQVNPVYGSLAGESYAKVNDYNLRYGKGFVIDNELMVTPYGELGYHKYGRTPGYGTPTSFQETYTHNEYGIGVLGQCSPIAKIVYSANLFIGRTFDSNIVVVFPAPYTGFSAELGNSTLYKVGASVDYAFTNNIHANLGAYVVGWLYGASAIKPIGNGQYAYEPESYTSITTAEVGIGLSF